jgi:hypothetical protein
MNEENKLNEIFGKVWKEKYPIGWCHLCDVGIITCPNCKNSTCNGGGCELCRNDFKEFHDTTKPQVEHYLTPDEVKIYHKGVRIRSLIQTSLSLGYNHMDLKKLDEREELSQNDHEMFNI